MPEEIRLKFYHTFTVKYDAFFKNGKIFLEGSSNARLGEFLNDLDIHEEPVSNKNKPNVLRTFRILWTDSFE